MADKKTTEEKPAATLRVHHLRPAPGAKTAKTRVGRGEASKGKTAGRGTKGTKARYQVPARFEGGQMPLHMRLPKLRGFKNPFRTEYQVVNLDKLTELFPEGGTVTVADLVAKGAVRKNQLVKVLGTGEAGAKFDITVDAASASAKSKIEAAGGSLTVK
ncbi:50S ribosomal protein L15 [Rarobacter incanus]|uniref:Large ribosomal subunit protein uL15 n=1 Tax=Rarobacter incanus TaxID=153494 RepID=A0A542SR35_9MICO|nr:50S ribosomal protein L15 [Rarobacter incanus]TQK77073.1 LSU ribosomal protein L15P [Rarobacter incanus]